MDRLEHEAFRDPRAILRAALSDFVTAGLDAFTHWLQRQPTRVVDYDDPRIDDAVDRAARLLGVSVGASADEVRAAFRHVVKAEISADAGFHDQGGDTTDPRAQRLIAAKNLLIQRARENADVEG